MSEATRTMKARQPARPTTATARQHEILATLTNEPRTTADIATDNAVSMGTITKHMEILHDLGFVVRHQDRRRGKVRWSRKDVATEHRPTLPRAVVVGKKT